MHMVFPSSLIPLLCRLVGLGYGDCQIGAKIGVMGNYVCMIADLLKKGGPPIRTKFCAPSMNAQRAVFGQWPR